MEPLYTFPRETWDAKKCWRKARYAPKDAWGNRPPKGIIASNASSYPQYGQTIKYNGGIYIEGVLYKAVHKPLPYIPACYEFYQLPGWGTAIRRKQA